MKSIHFLCLISLCAEAAGQVNLPIMGTNVYTIEQVVNEVLAKNPEVNFYSAEIAAAKGDRRTAGTLKNPDVVLQAGNKRQNEPGGLAGEGLAWSVSVNQTFEYPGRLALRKAIANRQIPLAELGYAQFRAALAARARRLGLAVISAGIRSVAALEVADRAKQLASVMVQRDPAGITPLLETRILEATAVTSQRRAADAGKELQSAMMELNQLRGDPVQHQVKIATPDLKFGSTPPLEEVLASARTNNFELKMREVELEQQGFKVQLSKNERYPAVTAGPFYSEEKARDSETRIGVEISVPIPVWNRNKGNIEAASARRTQAETSLILAQRDVEKRVVQAVTTYQAALGQLTLWPTNAVEHFQEAAELGDRHYRLGAIPISTYIELQKQYLEAIEVILNTEAEADDARQQTALLAGWIHDSSGSPSALTPATQP